MRYHKRGVYMLKDRRKYIRMQAALGFTYRLKGAQGPGQESVTRNISPGGIRGLIDKRIKKGDWIQLDIPIPAMERSISAVAKVIWTADEKDDKIDVGLKFEEIDPQAKNMYLEYICNIMFSELERLKA